MERIRKRTYAKKAGGITGKNEKNDSAALQQGSDLDSNHKDELAEGKGQGETINKEKENREPGKAGGR